jgi:hypothetical protein
MSVIMRETLVAASATVDNIISGSAFEIAVRPVLVSLGLTQSATGLVMTITSGSDLILEEAPIPIKATYPVIPDEFFFSDVMMPSERLVIRIRNTTAGALTVRVVVQVNAVA